MDRQEKINCLKRLVSDLDEAVRRLRSIWNVSYNGYYFFVFPEGDLKDSINKAQKAFSDACTILNVAQSEVFEHCLKEIKEMIKEGEKTI